MNTNPEKWREKLMDEFCVMFERATQEDNTIDWVEKLESFLRTQIAEAEERGRSLAVDELKERRKEANNS